jgi:glycosyltransferase involved in cell wall biosynthesis
MSQAMLRPLPERASAPPLDDAPPTIGGKFFFVGDRKLYLRGVSYGPFAPAAHGFPLPAEPTLERDLTLMAKLGANCLRTFTVPPRWLLDRAAEHGLRVLVTVPWAEHVCFLDDATVVKQIREQVREGARQCAGHPATFAVLIGNEIPPDIVRWHGPGRVAAFLGELHDEVKSEFPDVLVSYANFPSTEYLDLDFLDFVSFNVYLHREADLRRYLSRLQNLAGDKPLVLTELGMDSLREGPEEQARFLEWQIRAAAESGVAGTVVFAWTDDWFTGGFQVEDWAFGLVDSKRQRKPSAHAVQKLYRGPLPPTVANAPKVSIVVCAYNAERTINACLASMRELRYPSYEVIVVNDGSTDATREIALRYPEVVLIDQANLGLSVARNVGAAAATGEIVAYTDSDCVADPDWLTYLVYKFRDGFVAVGGPNLPPPEDSRVPACVAASPGGPTHVLLSDDVAEHIPGCNMAFRKSALEEIHGFDATYRAAGDDVDLCWRLQIAGYPIGFSPAAMVWHFRRNTMGAYLRQQMGYGKAEALLYFKHPYRFNLLGQSQWFGRIYGDFTMSLFSPRPIVYHGVFGRGLFQTLYESPASPLTYLPFTLEWNLAALVLLAGALIAGDYRFYAALPLLISFLWSLGSAWRAKVDPRFDGPRSRLLIALLVYLGPLVRSAQRYLWRLQRTANVERIEFAETSQKPCIRWSRWHFELAFWAETGLEKENYLHAVMQFLLPRKYLITIDQGWNDWDIAVHRGVFAQSKLKMAVENHGGAKRLFRMQCRLRPTRLSRVALLACAAVAALGLYTGLFEIAVVAGTLGLISGATIVYQNLRLGRVMYHVLEISAKAIDLKNVAGLGE